MKSVVIQRAWSDYRATLGMLSILGEAHDPFFTLENPIRVVTEDSRIPPGEYTCVPYSGEKYEGVYLVENVPERTAILIHWGNFERDTEGCILIGLGAGMMQGEPAVAASKNAFQKFKKIIGNKKFKLTVIDRSK